MIRASKNSAKRSGYESGDEWPLNLRRSRLEIGHVLFIDLVGYSKLLIEEQKERFGAADQHRAGDLSSGAVDQ